MYAKYLVKRVKYGKAKLWNVRNINFRIGNYGEILQEWSIKIKILQISNHYLLNGDIYLLETCLEIQ